MANTTDNIDLIPKEDLDRLKELDVSLKAVNKAFSDLMKTASGLATEFSKPINNAKALADAMGRLEDVEKKKTRPLMKKNA